MTPHHLTDLPLDLILRILKFLSGNDTAQFLVVNKLITSRLFNSLPIIWGPHFSQRWNLEESPTIKLLREDISCEREYRLLFPTCIPLINGITNDNKSIRYSEDSLTVEFLGTVGVSNRSVQSIQSFPIGQSMAATKSLVGDVKGLSMKYLSAAIYEALCFPCRTAIRAFRKDEVEESDSKVQSNQMKWCVPSIFASLDHCRENTAIPRLRLRTSHIVYYEVKIIPLHQEEPSQDDTSDDRSHECVAVGLGTKYFQRHKRLPGWDGQSYGYHSDDGAIFHGRGRQLKKYGPVFGYNDTIGCGVDYCKKSIFFTLNGRDLGVAFYAVPLEDEELFPTVGIDAKCSAIFNFGSKPFHFDLLAYENEIKC